MSGRAVAVKVYDRQQTKEVKPGLTEVRSQTLADNPLKLYLEAVKYSQNKWHPNIPRIMGVSPLDFEPAFLVFNDDYQGTAESMIAVALKSNLRQSLILGLQTVIGLSSGLDYLQDLNFPFASVGFHRFVILVSREGKIMISVDPESSDANEERQATSATEATGLEVFDRLCQKIFDAARKARHKGHHISWSYLTGDFDVDPEDPAARVGADAGWLPDSVGRSGSSDAPDATSTILPQHPLPRESHTREISRNFQDHLTTFLSSSNPALEHRQRDYTNRRSLRNLELKRTEITLTTDVEHSAVFSYSTSSMHMTCPICHQVVEDMKNRLGGCADLDLRPQRHSLLHADQLNRY
ncbi:hypothetical protein LshimejAT787_0701280 [Lyophyllum shimeji]|uniref:Uncharacterized protein n=1 Tax=Lyophyllum shimeji TaxID=47721 RepID=A0A9P3PQA6_LYOSH|nr:hypothetical protein LshimejAT787_0701280 [Lyophyllum shimeji]